MSSLQSPESISPTWYRLQTSAGGNEYIELPERTGGGQVFLTALRPTDNVAMTAMLDNPLFYDTLVSIPKPYTLACADYWITLQLSGQSGLPLQAIRSGDPDTGAYIGGITLIPAERAPSNATKLNPPADILPEEYELGYSLHPSYHKKGIMRDAVLAVLAWATKECGVKFVVVSAVEDNAASVKTIESIPVFSKVGTMSEVWPENKGGGVRKLVKYRWHYTG